MKFDNVIRIGGSFNTFLARLVSAIKEFFPLKPSIWDCRGDGSGSGVARKIHAGQNVAGRLEATFAGRPGNRTSPRWTDKIVQRAVVRLITPIYETMSHDFSYGFRPGRNPHQALNAVGEARWKRGIGWIVDADVSGFFDNMDHGVLREFLRRKVTDGGIHRF